MRKKKNLEETLDDTLKIAKSLMDKAYNEYILDLEKYYDDFVSHVLFLDINDLRENRFVCYKDYIYVAVFDKSGVNLEYVFVFERWLDREDEDMIDELFRDVDVFVRGINCICTPNHKLGLEGMWILQSGEVHFKYKYPNDGFLIDKDDYIDTGYNQEGIIMN